MFERGDWQWSIHAKLFRKVSVLLGVLVAGCATKPLIPVEELKTVPGHRAVPLHAYSPQEQNYRVQPGDTLSEIAYDYQQSIKQIALRNGLTAPYVLYPGQNIIIQSGNKKRRPPSKKVIKTPISSRLPTSGYKTSRYNEKQIHRKDGNSSAKRVIIEWEWPARGELVKKFNQGRPPSKGIRLAGRYGDPVHASADGVVVYVGEGLRGFGKMVILLHEGGYLSAYGNNRSIRVRENQKVKAGDIISEIGSSASENSELHFEMRLAGKPIDPLLVLPPRE